MPESLLLTKLHIPQLRPNLVPRPHLVKLLDQGLQLGHRLTLISAPAGFGKTTLVSEWVDRFRSSLAGESLILENVAWLSLDQDDNDPTRFLTYLISALNQVEGTAAPFGEAVMTPGGAGC